MIQLQSILFIIITITLKGGQSVDIKSLECDFTVDLCDWVDPTTVVWDIGDYEKALFGQPVKQVADGGFTSIKVPYTNEFVLESQILDTNTEPFCLYFNYYMFGPVTGSLTLQAVSIESQGGKSIKIQENVWRREGSQYDDWILGKYHVSPPPNGKDEFILQFVATSKDIALGPIRVKSGSCEYTNDCDFEDASLCFWTVEPDYRSNFRWLLTNGSESESDLVSADVTTGTGDGHFMRTPQYGMIDSTSSLSPVIYLVPNEARCLSFYFYKSSENSDFLEVDAKSTYVSSHLIWSSHLIPTIGQWVPINIDLNADENDEYFKVSLRASRITDNATPIAIDNIKISPQACKPTGSCDFNTGLCNYHTSSKQLLVGFGRLEDPSIINWDPIKNIDPYDLFVYTNTPKTDELVEYSLESSAIALDKSKCLTFSYALSFSRQASFSISLIPSDTKIPISIWTLDNPVSSKSWKTIELPKPLTSFTHKPSKLSFTFNGISLFMGIDDILLDSCTNQPEDGPEKSCNYDGPIDNKCIDIVPSVYNNWQFMDTIKLRQKVKPIFNDKDDQVLAFDLSIPSRSEATSYFYISQLKPYTPYCLQFWYIVDGNLKLNLWKDNLRDDFDEFLIIKPWYSFNNHFGLNWDQAKIQVDGVGPETMIIFGASYTSDSLGTVILDGLELIEGECLLDYQYLCNFEDDCIWDNFIDGKLTVTGTGKVYEAKTKWIEVTAKGRLPSRDANLKTIDGNYLTLDSVKGEEAIFTFPPIYLADNTSELCLRMYINPVSTNNLDIIIEQDGIVTLVEASSTPKGYQWLPFEALLKFNPKLSKVVHVYLAGSGSFAIDDLSIKMGSCLTSQFTCNDGKVLASSEVCDHKADCSGGEDEAKCGDCDFSVDFCGYEADTDANWSLEDGHAVVETKFGSLWGSKSSGITSPPLRPTSPTCKVQFQYTDRKTDSNQLKVLLLFQDGRDAEVWDDTMISKLEDDTIEIDLGRVPIPFNLQFYAKLSMSYGNRRPLQLGPIKLIDCGFDDTINGQSGIEIYTCKNGKRIRQEQVCDSSIDCFDGDDEVDCNRVKTYPFEDKEAPLYWINLENDRMKWTLITAEGSISSTPPRDHSRGLPGSNYMAIYPVKDLITSITVTKEISLIGPELGNIDGCSIVFYYNTAGVTLTISILNNTSTHDLMTIPTSLSFGFKRQRITLRKGDIEGRFNFVFKARYSALDMSNYTKPYYAVIDDVVIDSSCFSDSSEEPINPDTKCTHDDYHCKKDDTCIPSEKVCNYQKDCSDGADEINCGPCPFDGYTCGWTNEGEDDWVLPDDYYLDIEEIKTPEANKPKNFIIPDRRTSEIQAVLKSPQLGTTSSVCKFSFTYFLRQYATMSIRVKNEQSQSTRILELLPSTNEWDTREYKLESLSSGYYIYFILDITSSTLLKDLSPAGLANFQFTDCNPAWDPSWLTSTIPTTVTTAPTTVPTIPTTHITTKQPTTTIATTKAVVTTIRPTTRPVTTIKPETTPHHEILPTDAPKPITPNYDNPKSNGFHMGSAPFVLLGVITIVLVTVFTALMAKKRIFGPNYSPNGVIPLLETNFHHEEAIGQEGGISFRHLQQSDERNSAD